MAGKAKKKTTGKAQPSKAAKRAAPAKQARKPAARPGNGQDVQREVEQFLYRQSEMLDAKLWSAYLELFADEGVYSRFQLVPFRPDDNKVGGQCFAGVQNDGANALIPG